MEPSPPGAIAHFERCLIDDVVVDVGQRKLWRDGQALPVTRRTFDLLLTLMENSPNLVTHEKIIARVWGAHRIVSPETLAQCVLRLRNALGDSATSPRYIESIRGNGYRLLPPAQPLPDADRQHSIDSNVARVASTARSSWMWKWGIASIVFTVAAGLIAVLQMGIYSDTATSAPAASPRALEIQRRSVAVLPIESSGSNTTDVDIADGVYADFLSELARISELSVIARATMRRYADTNLSIPELAGELNVENVMQLEMRRTGQRLDIAAELIDGNTGAQIWFGRFDEHLDNVFGLQRALASSVADALGVRLTDTESARLQARPTTSAEAYELFLASVESFEIDFADRAMIARALLDKAIQLDSEFAAAYGFKALIYASGIDDFTDTDGDLREVQAERARLAEKYAADAIAIDPGTVVAYRARAVAAMRSFRWNEAKRAFESALEHGPNDVTALSEFAFFSMCALRDDAGLRYVERALELDPGNPRIHELLGRSLYCAGEFESALSALRRSVALDATNLRRRAQSAYVAARIRPAAEALEELRSLEPLLRDIQLQSMPPIALTYAQLGSREDAERLIARFDKLNGHATTNLGNSVFAYLAVGDDEAAYDTLERAIEQLGPGSGYLSLLAIRHNIRGVSALEQPRFVRLRERIRSLD